MCRAPRTAARQSRFPNLTVSPFRKYMALPCVAKLSAWRVHKRLGCSQIRFQGGFPVSWQAWRMMQSGVYGSGYLGTVGSACLADLRTTVTCCYTDSSRMAAFAQ